MVDPEDRGGEVPEPGSPAPREEGDTLELDLGGPLEELPVGAAVGRYIVLGRMSEFGLGEVYWGFDPHADRKVAIKLLAVDVEDEAVRDELVGRLVDRSRAVAAVDHPNVIRVLEVGTFDSGIFIATEFVEGLSLRRWMEARDEPFPWPQVLAVFREAGRGLAAAHAAGVAHGDLTPSNVFVRPSGRTAILDFGLAMPRRDGETAASLEEVQDRLPGILGDAGEHPQETPSHVFGTPAYLSPEQHLGARADPRSDQFAFCVCFYEALYGERPFEGDRRPTLALQTIRGNLRPPPAGSPVPSWLREVIVRGLSARRSDRYASMEALLRALDHDPAASRRRWRRGLATLGVLLTVAGGVGYLVHLEATRCETDEALLAGAWDPRARVELEAAFARAPEAYGASAWPMVESRLDEWANEWLELRTRACERGRDDEPGAEALLQRRYACLDARLSEVAAFTARFASGPREDLEHAPAVLSEIQPPRNCIEPATLDRYPPAPSSAAEAVAELRSLHDRAWVAHRTGDHDDAAALAERVQTGLAALENPYQPLRLTTRLLQALLTEAREGPRAAQLALHDVAADASSRGLVQIAAMAWLDLARNALAAGGTELASTWLRHARFAVSRSRDTRLRAILAERRGDLAAAAGRPADALSEYHTALDDLESDRGASPLAKARVLQKLGELVQARGEHASAQAYLERAVELMTIELGPDHPSLAEPLRRKASALLAQEQRELALAALEQALSLETRSHGASTRLAADLEAELGELELERGRAPNAALRFEHAVAIYRELGPGHLAALGDALHGLGKVYLQLGKSSEARVALAEALPLRRARGRSLRRETGRTEELLARALWAEDQRAAARDMAQQARESYLLAAAKDDLEPLDAWLSSLR